MSGEKVEVGDKVSWNWNGSTPSGKAAEVTPGEVTVTSHRGNEIKKSGDEQNPAVHIERSGNDVVKTANELHVESKGTGGGSGQDGKQDEEGEEMRGEKKDTKDQNGAKKNGISKDGVTASPGDKRKAHQKNVEKDGNDGVAEEPASKKPKINGKKGGRPKGKGAQKEKRVPATGKSERKTRSQGSA